jgi:hypothetical protein
LADVQENYGKAGFRVSDTFFFSSFLEDLSENFYGIAM